MTTHSSNPPDTLPEDLICACTGLRLDAYREKLLANPDLSFEGILQSTGAGASCTACLLDLEYFYVSTPRTGSQPTGSASVSMATERSLKRKIFDFIDDHSPPVPFILRDRFPVIAGAGLDQHIWVSNRSLLFEGERAAPAFKIAVTVRNGDGKVCHRESRVVEPEDALDLPVSHLIATSTTEDDAFSVGSVEVRRQGTEQGFRGTTRPQTEILARDGSCSVHGQGYKYPGERWFSCVHHPKDQRVFISFINFANAPNDVALSYPMNVDNIGVEARHLTFKIPPHGAIIHEIQLTEEEANQISDRQVAMRWICSAGYNSHIFCATPDLGRLSIDHS
jgi:hypothetical protein